MNRVLVSLQFVAATALDLSMQPGIDDLPSMAADNQLLKRSLFGSRRERYDDPAQILLFDPATLVPPEQPTDTEPPPQPKKKRTSKGRQPRVFPEFLPREEQRFLWQEEDLPGRMEFKAWTLFRDGNRCRRCGTRVTWETDHIKPVCSFASYSQATHLLNLQTLCLKCHKEKSRGD